MIKKLIALSLLVPALAFGQPAGSSTGATSGKQDIGNASLASIDGKITAVNTGAVVVSSSALPSGAATSANQSTIIGHVDGIEGLLGTTNTNTGNTATSTANIDTDTTTIIGHVDGIEALLGTGNTNTGNIATSTANIDTDTTTIIGHVDGVETLIGTTNTNTGNSATSLGVIDDWDESDRGKVNIIVGQAGVAAGTGVDGATVPRVSLATNVPLPAGTNVLGSVTASNPTTATATLSNVSASASNVTLLASNASRKMALIFNDSTAVLYVKFGATASTTSFTVKLMAGAYYELPLPVYTGIIDGIWASATGAARMTEL